MQVDWKNHLVSTPDVLRGKPRIKGTRIPVSLILGYLAMGNTLKKSLESSRTLRKNKSLPAWIMLVIYQNLRWPFNGSEILCRPLYFKSGRNSSSQNTTMTYRTFLKTFQHSKIKIRTPFNLSPVTCNLQLETCDL